MISLSLACTSCGTKCQLVNSWDAFTLMWRHCSVVHMRRRRTCEGFLDSIEILRNLTIYFWFVDVHGHFTPSNMDLIEIKCDDIQSSYECNYMRDLRNYLQDSCCWSPARVHYQTIKWFVMIHEHAFVVIRSITVIFWLCIWFTYSPPSHYLNQWWVIINWTLGNKSFHSQKCISKYRLLNGGHFVQGEMNFNRYMLTTPWD